MPRKRTGTTKTTQARKRTKDWKKLETMRIATWNIKSFNNKDQEIMLELEQHKIDICALQETRIKGKGQKLVNNYVLVYSGVEKGTRSKEGVGLMISRKHQASINECEYISSRILKVSMDAHSTKVHVVVVYAPESCKAKHEREQFYEELQDILEKIPSHETLIVLGDFNARIGNKAIPGVMQRFNEDRLNDSGEMLINLCAQTELRINNTFFQHKTQHKLTFANTRGHQTTIDYILTNRKVHPSQIIDVRTLNSANINTDHNLLMAKISIKLKLSRNTAKQLVKETKFILESLTHDQSTKLLYQKRLSEKIESKPIKDEQDIDEGWTTLKGNIVQAATEALGTRTTSNTPKNNKTPWFCSEVKKKCEEKKKAYLQYKTSPSPETYEHFKSIRNETKTLVRRVKQDHWEGFTKAMERDFYGIQKQIWRLIRSSHKEMNELSSRNPISKEEWQTYLTNLYRKTNNGSDKENNEIPETVMRKKNNEIPEIVLNDSTNITEKDITTALTKTKNRKSPGPDGINNEMLKYGGKKLYEQLTTMLSKILNEGKIPDEWRRSTSILLFKKGLTTDPGNYRAINLLNSSLKLLTKIITTKINEATSLSEEQQGFRSGRSCNDAVFTIRQIIEKSIEYNKPAYLCCIDLVKAFDRVQLQDVILLLQKRQVPYKLIRLIENIYTLNTVQAKVKNQLTEPIAVEQGIRQGDSLSPALFNIVIDEVINKVTSKRGYRMGQKQISIVCYADDAMIAANSEDELQILLHTFNQAAKQYNMSISTAKTKCMTISKTPIRCKLEVDGVSIEQVMKATYLGVEISAYGDIEQSVQTQAAKASRIAGCLSGTIFKNKYLRIETKGRIYRAVVRPIATYTAETRAVTKVTERILENVEMKIVRKINDKTLVDQQRSADLRRKAGVTAINEWVADRRQKWNEHIDRMSESRMVRIARDNSPTGRRSVGRPRKRWSDHQEEAHQ